jgi:hypothetical protein
MDGRMFKIVELNCEDYQIRAGSIGHGQDGCFFRCTISPVADSVVNDLATAVRLGATVRLVFPEQPLLLERVAIERIDVTCFRIVGRIVDGSSEKNLGPYALSDHDTQSK